MKRIVRYFGLIYLLFLSCSVGAQVIVTGTVVDETNAAIEFANVVLLNSQNNVVAGTITDKKGYFTIKTDNSKNLTLKISFVGFKSYIKSPHSFRHL